MPREILFTILLVSVFIYQAGYAADAVHFVSKAKIAAKSGDIDFAFINYHAALNSDPDSLFKADALFATGEYYFLKNDYTEAAAWFEQYLSQSADINGQLFARFYLWEIAQSQHQTKLAEKLRKGLETFRKHIFIFRDSQEYHFRSPLNRLHRAVYTIRGIDFYLEGELVAKIPF